MNEQAYQNWCVLHRRKVIGENLSEIEESTYAAGCQELDADELLDGNIEQMRTLRGQIARAEVGQERLWARERVLDARIAALEARLDQRTRHLLGIGS